MPLVYNCVCSQLWIKWETVSLLKVSSEEAWVAFATIMKIIVSFSPEVYPNLSLFYPVIVGENTYFPSWDVLTDFPFFTMSSANISCK